MPLTFSETFCYLFNLKNGDIFRGYINNQDEYFFEIKLENPNDFKVSIKLKGDIIYLAKSEIKNFYKVKEI